ncbi:MAG: hypothetical protein AB1384_12355 [Actinomycetota bacterium]
MIKTTVIFLSILVAILLVTSNVFAVLYFTKDSGVDTTQANTVCLSQMRSIKALSEMYAAFSDDFSYPDSWMDLVPEYLEGELYCPLDGSEYIIEWSYYEPPEISCPNHGSG